MKIVEIVALDNGAHRNQSGNFQSIPDGWAIIPDDMNCENFPFGEVEAEEINGVMTVTKWTAGVMPEPEPVEHIKTAEERITELEEIIALTDETTIEMYEALMAQEKVNIAQDDALIEIYEMIGEI